MVVDVDNEDTTRKKKGNICCIDMSPSPIFEFADKIS